MTLHAVFQPHLAFLQEAPIRVDPLFIDGKAKAKGLPLIFCERHVFEHGQPRAGADLRILKHTPDEPRPLIFGKPCNVLAAKEDAPLLRTVCAADQVEHRRLAAAVGADY